MTWPFEFGKSPFFRYTLMHIKYISDVLTSIKSTSVRVHPKSDFENSQNLSNFELNMIDYGKYDSSTFQFKIHLFSSMELFKLDFVWTSTKVDLV
jgi:hypothetical protein